MFLDDNAAVHVGEAEVAESAAFVHHGMIGHPTKLVRSDVKKRYFWVVNTTKSGPPHSPGSCGETLLGEFFS